MDISAPGFCVSPDGLEQRNRIQCGKLLVQLLFDLVLTRDDGIDQKRTRVLVTVTDEPVVRSSISNTDNLTNSDLMVQFPQRFIRISKVAGSGLSDYPTGWARFRPPF